MLVEKKFKDFLRAIDGLRANYDDDRRKIDGVHPQYIIAVVGSAASPFMPDKNEANTKQILRICMIIRNRFLAYFNKLTSFRILEHRFYAS